MTRIVKEHCEYTPPQICSLVADAMTFAVVVMEIGNLNPIGARICEFLHLHALHHIGQQVTIRRADYSIIGRTDDREITSPG